MDSFKGTPGPWNSKISTTEIYIQAGTIETARIEAGSENGLSETEYENARLISAAPDLLEALVDCESTLACIQVWEADERKYVIESVKKARVAIKKALGLEVTNG